MLLGKSDPKMLLENQYPHTHPHVVPGGEGPRLTQGAMRECVEPPLGEDFRRGLTVSHAC